MEMNKIKVTHKLGEYTIYSGEGILEGAISEFLAGKKYDRIFAVSDSNVYPLHGARLESAVKDCGRELAGVHIFEAGEKSKTLATVSEMYVAFSKAKLTRKSLILALGGGVCGDMAGFASATWLRGIDIVQIPTTLLSQIDSSIGGKTGVDLEVGKNLVGAFHQPAAVIADSSFLATLPERYIRDGMGEAIKSGLIADAQLFESIRAKTIDRGELITRCMRVKAEVVIADENETGLRKILNYGHTIGHAVEKLGNFERYSHGESVGIGMLYAAQLGAKLGFVDLYEPIRETLEAWGLPTEMIFAPSELAKVAASDKKRAGDSVSFVLLDAIGSTKFVDIKVDEIEAMLS